MIDFRYHIVSLISVFLALAVGIILGAGPLQNAIGDQLTDQVAALRTERNDLREQLATADAKAADDARMIEAAGPQLVADSLAGRRVALVDVDGTDAARDKQLAAQFEAAGAAVVARVRLTSSWTDESDASVRKTVADGLAENQPDLAADASVERRLGQTLAIALTGAQPENPAARSSQAVDLEGQLVRFELISVRAAQAQPAEAIVLVSGSAAKAAEPAASPSATKPADSAIDAEVELAVAAQAVAKAALVIGPTARSGDLISTIRNRNAADTISTVSGIEAEAGRISVPLALAARLGAVVGQYGFESSATDVLPPAPARSSTEGATPTAKTKKTPTGAATTVAREAGKG